MVKAILIHGMALHGGDIWLPGGTRADRAGLEVNNQTSPTTSRRARSMVTASRVARADPDTILIGHSSGAVRRCAMRKRIGCLARCWSASAHRSRRQF